MERRLEEGEQQDHKKKGECEKNRIEQMKKRSLPSLSPPFLHFTGKHYSTNNPLLVGAGIAQSVKRLATGWTTRGSGSSSPGRVKTFSLLHIVQTGSGVHPTSYKMGIRVKATGA
jgi:hypothetical protein